MNKSLQVFKYVILDLLAAALAWSLFFFFRKYSFDDYTFKEIELIFHDRNFFIGIVVIPVFWLIIYTLVGTYRRIYRKSRLKELGQTFMITLIGVTIIFFALILDDQIATYRSYYQSFLTLLGLQFSITYLFRLILTTITVRKIHKKLIGFNTIIVGSNGNAIEVYNDIELQETSSGNIFVGFVNVFDYEEYKIGRYINHLGNYIDLKKIINEYQVEEVIIAIERSERSTIEKIITLLEDTNVVINVIPDMQDILLGSVKMTSVFHTPLIQITPDLMPAWQQSVKRIIDIVASLIAMVVLIPVYIFVAVGVKLSSKGPFLYSQERVGLNGTPFHMHKFRTMFKNAENAGPQLSSDNDPRITKFGKFLRKVRLDETPQFYTVLKGDMSLVGPRPERQYYIDKIVKEAPHYRLLQKVKPGITSWGQVKYGYAMNVDEMIKRLKYDLLYIENMSLFVDFQIMIFTILTLFRGRHI